MNKNYSHVFTEKNRHQITFVGVWIRYKTRQWTLILLRRSRRWTCRCLCRHSCRRRRRRRRRRDRQSGLTGVSVGNLRRASIAHIVAIDVAVIVVVVVVVGRLGLAAATTQRIVVDVVILGRRSHLNHFRCVVVSLVHTNQNVRRARSIQTGQFSQFGVFLFILSSEMLVSLSNHLFVSFLSYR